MPVREAQDEMTSNVWVSCNKLMCNQVQIQNVLLSLKYIIVTVLYFCFSFNMAINTILLDLSVDPLKIVEKITLQSTLREVLSKFLPELKETHSTDFKNGGFMTTFTAVRDSFVTVRSFPKGLVAINIEYFRDDGEEPLLNFEVSRFHTLQKL